MLHPLSLCPIMRVEELIAGLDGIFPFSYALSWDNSGLQVGDPAQELTGVTVALDPNLRTIEETLKCNTNCLVTHHPLLFRSLKRISAADPVGEAVFALAKNSISLISLHTNLDVAPGGLADRVAKLLEVEVEGPMMLEEDKGLGRVGYTSSSFEFYELLALVKESLNLKSLRVVNPPPYQEKRVWKIALCPGSGGDLVFAAASTGAQVYLTGDLKYHQATEALELGITVVDAGHYGTERPAVDLLAETVRRIVDDGVFVNEIEGEDPFQEV